MNGKLSPGDVVRVTSTGQIRVVTAITATRTPSGSVVTTSDGQTTGPRDSHRAADLTLVARTPIPATRKVRVLVTALANLFAVCVAVLMVRQLHAHHVSVPQMVFVSLVIWNYLANSFIEFAFHRPGSTLVV